MINKRSFLSSIGLLLSFIGMVGLVLSIISLLPLNSYNIYTTVITSLKLLQFEHERTDNDWKNIELSQDAVLYLIFLTGSCLSSLLEIILTLVACCRHQTKRIEKNQQGVAIQRQQSNEEEQDFLTLINDSHSPKQQQQQQKQEYNQAVNKKSWFIRITCFTLLIQIMFSLFGTHIVYKMKSDVDIIPIEIQHNTYISCAILWINYLSLTVFSIVLLFASFFILIGAYTHNKQLQKHHRSNSTSSSQNEETRPLIP